MALGRGHWGQNWEAGDRHFHSSSSPATDHYPCPPALALAVQGRLVVRGCLSAAQHSPAQAALSGRSAGPEEGGQPPDTAPREPALFPLQGLSSGCVLPAPGVRPFLSLATQPRSGSFLAA